MRKHFSIAIDGPAGAGKSTVAKAVAKALGAVYLDTGAMYRTMGLYMSDNGITGPERIASASAKPEVQVRFIGDAQHMVLDGTDVTDRIHTPEASLMASKVSAVPAVRERMVALQRGIAQGHSVVMDGRDIGTKVLPDATLKVFLTASAEVRARRRYDELSCKGMHEPYEKVLEELIRRDEVDTHREASPLRKAEDAVEVDCSQMTLEEVVETVVSLARQAVEGKA